MSFTKVDSGKVRDRQKHCYRCGTNKKVRTFGNNDWCPKCKKEVDGFRNDGTTISATPRGHREHVRKVVARAPVVTDEQLELIQPRPCRPLDPEPA